MAAAFATRAIRQEALSKILSIFDKIRFIPRAGATSLDQVEERDSLHIFIQLVGFPLDPCRLKV